MLREKPTKMTPSSRSGFAGSWPTKCTCIPCLVQACAITVHSEIFPSGKRILNNLTVLWLGLYRSLHLASSQPWLFENYHSNNRSLFYSGSEIVIKIQLQISSNAWRAVLIALPTPSPLSALWTQRIFLPEPFLMEPAPFLFGLAL